MKYTLLLPFLFLKLGSFAQNNRAGIAVFYGLSDGEISTKKGYVGGHGIKNEATKFLGVAYHHELAKNLFIESGLAYFSHKYTTSPSSSLGPNANTGLSTPHTLKLLNIPLKIRVEVGRYIYFNGGPFLDLQIDKNVSHSDRFSGMGANIGAGLQYYFKNNIGVFANPQVNFHNLISRNLGYRFNDVSIGFGAAYRLK